MEQTAAAQIDLQSIRIMVVDEQTLFRQIAAKVISEEPGFRVIADVGSCCHARAATLEHQIDLAIIGLSLPDGSGSHLVKELKSVCPDIKVIVLTSEECED